jgi:Mg-chelatase subunit ChlD
LHFTLRRAIQLEDYEAARYIFGDLLNLIQSLYSRQHRSKRETEQMTDAASEMLGIRLPRLANGDGTGSLTASEATKVVTTEICRSAGDKCFSFRYLNFPNTMVVLIDTTGSMYDDIEQAKNIAMKLAKISQHIWGQLSEDIRKN